MSDWKDMSDIGRSHDTQAERHVIDLLTGAWRTQAISVAAQLGLADHIAAGRDTLGALAEHTGTDADRLRRLLRLLVSLAVFSGDESTGYRLTASGNLLRTRVQGSMRDMCDLYGREFYSAWGSALPAITEGIPAFERAFGQPLGEYLHTHGEARSRFQRAMNAGHSFLDEVPVRFDFSSARTVVDVAGGAGALLASVLWRYPDIRGVLFDLPHVLPLAEKNIAERCGERACDFVAGDMFESIPDSGDVYLLSRVLQDWSDEACLTLLGNCRKAMRPDARLLIIDRIVPDDGSFDLALLWDLHLMMMVGGRQRTAAEYHQLLDAAGLVLIDTVPLPLDTHMLVAVAGTGGPAAERRGGQPT